MNALFDTLDLTVAYASDAIIPTSSIPDIHVHHEQLDQAHLEGIVEKIGGRVTGEYAQHTNGETIDMNQFEKSKEENAHA